MVEHTVKRTISSSPDAVLRLAASSCVFMAMWPFVVEFDCHDTMSPSVKFRFKRFGFSTEADYKLRVNVGSDTVEYVGESGKRKFTLRVKATPEGVGARVEVTVSYTGPYETFARPIVEKFAEQVASKLASAAEERVETPNLEDASFVANLLALGRLIYAGDVVFTGVADVHRLLNEMAEQSKGGGRVLVRIRTRDFCARLLFENGRLADAVLFNSQKLRGPTVLEALLDKLRGTAAEVLAVKVE